MCRRVSTSASINVDFFDDDRKIFDDVATSGKKKFVFIESQVICIFRALNVNEGFDKIVNDEFQLETNFRFLR